jgi:hypothetical protein
MFSVSRWRRPVPLAVLTVLAVSLAACGGSSAPAAHGGSGGTHVTTTSTTASSSGQRPTTTSAPLVTTTTAPASQELSFSPFTATGGVAQGLQVTQQLSGRCTSPGVAGAASYRCTAEPLDVSYDPCFAAPGATGGPLLCVPDPTATDITRFAIGTLPQAPKAEPQKSVWAVRLGNGEICVHVLAAWAAGRGPYACPTPSTANQVADCHAPAKTAQGWTIECQAAQNDSSPFDTVQVVNVWT